VGNYAQSGNRLILANGGNQHLTWVDELERISTVMNQIAIPFDADF
jgi:hypothetical protein